LKVSANVKIAIHYFENFGGANAPNAPPGCAPVSSPMTRCQVMLWCAVGALLRNQRWEKKY